MAQEVQSADAAIDVAFEPETPPEVAVEAQPTDEAAEPVESPATNLDDQPRDEKGRFVAKDGQQEPEAAPAEGAPDSPPAEPTADTADEQSAESAEEIDLSEFPRFTYKAAGQEFEIPGSAVGERGIYIPTEAIPELRQLLASGKTEPQRYRERQQVEAQLTTRAEAAEEQARTILRFFDDLVEKNQLEDFLLNQAQNWEVLKARAEAAGVRRQFETERQELEHLRQEREDAQQRPLMLDALGDAVRRYGSAAGLDERAQERLYARWATPDALERVFPRADKDDPAKGVRKGQRLYDFAPLVQDVQWLQGMLGTKPASAQPAPQPVAKKAPVPAKPVKVPPTAAAAKGAAAPSGPRAKDLPKYTSSAEALEDIFDRGRYEDWAS